MHGFEFLDEIVLLSVVAVIVIVLFNKFKLPPVIGLIATGLLVGPSGFALVAQTEVITAVSELGIVLLLFSIGLEFSLDDLRRLKSIVLIGGPAQVVLSTIVIGTGAYTVAQFTTDGISIQGALLMGMAMALSSTAICTKILKDRRELGLPHGRAVMGILIFQDIAVVPMMIIVTLLSPASTLAPLDIVVRIGTLIVVTLVLVFGLRFALPRMVPYVMRVSTPEVLILGGLALCFGTAWITSMAGISMALGAFIAGVAIAGSEEGHAFARVLQPMRDAFTSMFFLSIGLLVTISWSWMPVNIVTALAVLAVNTLAVILVLISIRINLRTAVMAGIILAQVGEFSFVLATAGFQYGLISSFDHQNMIVSIIITMIVTPTLITIAPRFAERASPWIRTIPQFRKWYEGRPRLKMETVEELGKFEPTVLIVGGGVLGTNVARVLKLTGIPNAILELNGGIVAELRRDGHDTVHGDMTDPSVLEYAGIRRASVVVIAISDHTALAHGVQVVRKLRPDALIIARARYAKDSEKLARNGADVVVTEEYESSIQVFVTVLEHMGVDEQIIRSQEEAMREDRYGLLGRIQPPNVK